MSSTELKVRWSKKEKDILFEYPRRCDGALLHYYMGSDIPIHDFSFEKSYELRKSLFKELEDRGYDLTTLKFSIKLKKEINN